MAVGDGMRVDVIVLVGVMLGVWVIVGEGPVAVGNGPKRAFCVCAKAVFVPFAFLRRLFTSRVFDEPKMLENNKITLINKADAIRICRKTRFSLTFKFTRSVLLRIKLVSKHCSVRRKRNVSVININDEWPRG
ncbi:MAG TPA: hypothetical protein VFM05_11530, partial [Candidatus Saccharimonadales bacterium]|nr:hypothetical protein [Candidatus Saccharimonadales bacterium]